MLTMAVSCVSWCQLDNPVTRAAVSVRCAARFPPGFPLAVSGSSSGSGNESANPPNPARTPLLPPRPQYIVFAVCIIQLIYFGFAAWKSTCELPRVPAGVQRSLVGCLRE